MIAIDKGTMIVHLEALHTREQKVDGVVLQVSANRRDLKNNKEKRLAALLDGRDDDLSGLTVRLPVLHGVKPSYFRK